MDKAGRSIGGYTLERPFGDGGDRSYPALEYVEGEPIDRWCEAHRLGVAARIRLFLLVLEAVSQAHGRKILHRDLKPSNVHVTAEGVVTLLPGAHRRMQGAALAPDYAAPEQVLRTEVTAATDVYALGVMLYVLLTGKHPTADDASTPFERLRALAEHDPAPASEAAQSTRPWVASALRGDLDNILAKALQKSLLERYTTVDAFAEDLKRYLESTRSALHHLTIALSRAFEDVHQRVVGFVAGVLEHRLVATQEMRFASPRLRVVGRIIRVLQAASRPALRR